MHSAFLLICVFIFSDVSGHFVKSVSTAKEQVLPRPNSVGGEQGGPAGTPQNDKREDTTVVTQKPKKIQNSPLNQLKTIRIT